MLSTKRNNPFPDLVFTAPATDRFEYYSAWRADHSVPVSGFSMGPPPWWDLMDNRYHLSYVTDPTPSLTESSPSEKSALTRVEEKVRIDQIYSIQRRRSKMRRGAVRTTPSVFLETTVLKASKDTRLALLPEPKRVKWGAREFEVEVHRPVFVNQNVKYLVQGNYERFGDTVALRFVAALAKEDKIHLLSHNEVFFELMGLPRVAGGGPWFYGAPIRKVKSPIQYDRIIVDASGHDYQYDFLSRLNHPRFRELQTVCGAFQGHNRPLHRNQLIDAFHMWCAESSGAMYLLTLDDRLIRTLGKRKMSSTSVTPITPKRLLVALASKHPIWLWSMARERMRITHSGRKLHEAAQDASREFWS